MNIYSASIGIARTVSSSLILGGLLLPVIQVQAAETIVAEQTGSIGEKGDQFQEKWSKRVLKLADSIDSFFGKDRVEDDAQQTRVKLRFDFEHEELDGFDARARLSARISLPRTEKKWSLIINGVDNEDDDDSLEEDSDRSVAIRFDSENTRKRNISFDIGLRRPQSSYELFARARHRKTVPVGSWMSRFDNQLFAYTSFGLEYDGKLEFDRVLPPSLLFRSKTRLRWWENDSKCNGGVCPEQHFILYQRLKSPSHALSYEANTFFESKPTDGSSDHLEEGRLVARYRHRTWWDWAYFEIAPTLAFPRHDGYEPNWRILFRLEGIFGYKPKYDTLAFGPERSLHE